MKGLLFLNIGTPTTSDLPGVRRYLKEFLMDPLILNMPLWLRWCLVHGVILPRHAHQSCAAYQKIWTSRGSPLRFHSLDLVEAVQNKLSPDALVRCAMRYGQPSIEDALKDLIQQKNIQTLTIFPLYPQYALATTESSLREVFRILKKLHSNCPVQVIPPFYQHPAFIHAWAHRFRSEVETFDYDHVLLSFHGLPESHLHQTDASPGQHCLRSTSCCDSIQAVNQQCYRAHCYQTAKLLAQELALPKGSYQIGFQSRFGKMPWIQPWTETFLRQLPQQGIQRLVVCSPSFVADGLETLEEIQIRGRETWIRAGGKDLKLIPSLNASEVWVQAIKTLLLTAVPRFSERMSHA